jgi:hypothetical protein
MSSSDISKTNSQLLMLIPAKLEANIFPPIRYPIVRPLILKNTIPIIKSAIRIDSSLSIS